MDSAKELDGEVLINRRLSAWQTRSGRAVGGSGYRGQAFDVCSVSISPCL